MSDHWAIVPWVNAPEMTWHAVEDLLAQTVPTRILLIGQGTSKEDRAWIDEAIDKRDDHRVLSWAFNPPLPSLSAVWNRALRFVWELGGTEALVVNNDVRLHKRTYEWLLGAMNVPQLRPERRNLFVSAVGVRAEQFDPDVEGPLYQYDYAKREVVEKGGPDFSCFLISKAGHEQYPFDEAFIPAYHEDLDVHRRYMLGGEGDKIFSVNLPYLHYASGTIKHYAPEERQRFEKGLARSRAHYLAKWGGPVNEETFYVPFDGSDEGLVTLKLMRMNGLPVTTPDLQRYWLAHA